MLRDSVVISLTKEMEEERNKLREFYQSEIGQKELFTILSDSIAFDQIDHEKKVEMHNSAIYLMERLGLLDESKVKACIAFLLNLPALYLTEMQKEERKKKLEDYEKQKESGDVPDTQRWLMPTIPY